jgi:hypothetical protein
MSYLLDIPDILDFSYADLTKRLAQYQLYLESIRGNIPSDAYAFAVADWHYDFGDPRAPHDSWLDELVVSISSSGARSEVRSCDIHARFVGAYHDGYIQLHYKNVHEYSIVDVHEWQYDEITLGEGNRVIHEIRFDADSFWRIECDDILYEWEPF